MVKLRFVDQKTRETTTAATTATTKKQRNRKHMVRVLKNSCGKKMKWFMVFLMVKLKPSSQKTIHLKRQAFHGGDISTPSKNASPSPLSSMAIHVTSFWSEALCFFCERKTSSTFVLFQCHSCTFMQVALSFFAKVHIPVHFCSCLVDYIFFVQKKRGWSWNTLSQMDASNFGFHFFGCLEKYTPAKSLISWRNFPVRLYWSQDPWNAMQPRKKPLLLSIILVV